MSRQLLLNSKNPDKTGECVIYVMSRDQRVHDNHALLSAQKSALESKLPLFVVFNLNKNVNARSREHYKFMIDGLNKLDKELNNLGINFILTICKPVTEIINLSNKLNPKEIFFDFNPLSEPRKLQKEIASKLQCRVSVIDTHNIIPAWILSDKEEFAAHTIRSKVHKNLAEWLEEPEKIVKHPYICKNEKFGTSWDEAEKFLEKIPKNNSKINFKSGEAEAKKILDNFIENKLSQYAKLKNDPNEDALSNLSPYLHFGQISSLRVTLEVIKKLDEPPLLLRKPKLVSFEGEPTKNDSINAFLEELIVRKELADNYCFYNPNYKNFDGAKDWAKETLIKHGTDDRDYIYEIEDWENSKTHDDEWNAAQNEMMKTGKMHGYMRMYWAKKILEWSESPDKAIETAIYLNDKYSLDGGDPNGYVGIMWSIAGLHDRPWFERDVFGKIRYMNRGGLERKFDLQKYINKWI